MATQANGSPGAVIAGLRAQRGLTQGELAAVLILRTGSSWSQSKIARIETGQRGLRLEEATELAAVFGVDLADIAAGDMAVIDRNQRPNLVRILVSDLARAMNDASNAMDAIEQEQVSAAEISAVAGDTPDWADTFGVSKEPGHVPTLETTARNLLRMISELTEGLQ